MRIWDHINECLADKSTAISHEEYPAAQSGALDVTTAGKRIVPRERFPPLKGRSESNAGYRQQAGQEFPPAACFYAVFFSSSSTLLDKSSYIVNSRLILLSSSLEIL